ncbi:MAG TPA: Uma2 family endonuclease [Bryobacteraceae bacterium]|nr:Uma2 family endonuclease [Bryobacteraceae bacterium]
MPATALLTSEQYLALPEEFDQNGNRIKDELIGGEIVKMPPPSRVHDLIKNRINRFMGRYLDANPQVGLDTLVEIGAEVSKHDTFVPDVSIVKTNRLGGEDRIFRGAPDLAIEVVSPRDTATHLKSKVDAYLKAGSATVWVVYPDSRSVMVHSGDTARELKADQRIEDALLPGFSVPVSSFFDL